MKEFKKPDIGVVFGSAAVMALASLPILSIYKYHSEKMACIDAGGTPIPKVIAGGKGGGMILDRCEMKPPK
jgi:hypothetical protein